ncbi:AAA family ATPase [Lactiplantibacillus paraxiangfangensis]|uniref:AAA family ATPase n=1 Tax=Lactiplantibacillus paraxiangfangensis TaxID=3076224 RepID=UPI0030C7840C
MNYYLVGEKKRSLFSRQSTWDFNDALEAAEDGDVIEIEEGFCPINSQDNQSTVIRKNITIQGHVTVNDQGGQTFTNTLDGIVVTDGAQVTLKDVCIQKNIDKSNNIGVRKGSTLIADNVYIRSTVESGTMYPIVYIDGKSHAKFNRVQIDAGKTQDKKNEVYVSDASLDLVNSIIYVRVLATNATVICQQSTINCQVANAIYSEKNSHVTIESSTLIGGLSTPKTFFACVRVFDSQLTIMNSSINQPKLNRALLVTNGKVTLTGGSIDSMKVTSSTVTIDETVIQESLIAEKKSTISAKRFFIVGKENGTVNLYMSSDSSIKADRINFGILTNPNIKLERNVDFKVGVVGHNQYDQEKQAFLVDENNNYVPAATKGKITYFGDLTAYEQLNNMIGIKNVKDEVNEFIAIAEMNKKRKDKGLSDSAMTLHSLFLGNPGTGKTTVARILGKVLYEKKIIANQKFIEVSRSDLVGQYVGQTAVKTREVLESALGGVLFVDEAYTLASGGKNDFGSEAIDEILKFMEDHRSDIVIIFAGYTDSMEKFLQMNEGLKSRIPNSFNFEDYTQDELVQIGLLDLKKKKYRVDEATYTELVHHNFEQSDDHSNGRWIRNLNERLVRKMAVRIAGNEQADLSLITAQDLNAAKL